MNRTELTIAAAAALFAAILVGWGLRWFYGVMNPPPPPEPLDDSEWAQYAKAWEQQRNEAYAKLDEVERDMSNRLTQAQAELDAAMEALGDTRRSAQELEAEVARLREAQSTSA
ncbi:MAG: hypothetical protein AAF245_03770 [Pseudomonadota bacterium]